MSKISVYKHPSTPPRVASAILLMAVWFAACMSCTVLLDLVAARSMSVPLFLVLFHGGISLSLRRGIILFDSKSLLFACALTRDFGAAVLQFGGWHFTWAHPSLELVTVLLVAWGYSVWSTFRLGRLSGAPLHSSSSVGSEKCWTMERGVLVDINFDDVATLVGQTFTGTPQESMPPDSLRRRIREALSWKRQTHRSADHPQCSALRAFFGRGIIFDAVLFRDPTSLEAAVRVDVLKFIWIGFVRLPLFIYKDVDTV